MCPSRVAALLLRLCWAVAVVSACGSSSRQYSVDELARGVAIAANDPNDVVEDARVFIPPDQDEYAALSPQLLRQGAAVLRNVDSEPGYDVVVVYRTGPFCGLLPTVDVGLSYNVVNITVESVSRGACDAMEYDEALAIRLTAKYRDSEVSATHTLVEQ